MGSACGWLDFRQDKQAGRRAILKISRELPEGCTPLPEPFTVEAGDWFAYGPGFTEVRAGSPWLGRLPADVPGGKAWTSRLHNDEPMPMMLADALLRRADAIVAAHGIVGLRSIENHPSACACIGSIDNEPLCACAMWSALVNRKNELADIFENTR